MRNRMIISLCLLFCAVLVSVQVGPFFAALVAQDVFRAFPGHGDILSGNIHGHALLFSAVCLIISKKEEKANGNFC